MARTTARLWHSTWPPPLSYVPTAPRCIFLSWPQCTGVVRLLPTPPDPPHQCPRYPPRQGCRHHLFAILAQLTHNVARASQASPKNYNVTRQIEQRRRIGEELRKINGGAFFRVWRVGVQMACGRLWGSKRNQRAIRM